MEIDEDQENQYKHAMRLPSESVETARSEANSFVAGNMRKAIQLQMTGAHGMALHFLGLAMHVLQDATCPMHRGFQLWDPTWGIRNPEFRAHIYGEAFDPGANSELDLVTYGVYAYFASTVGVRIPSNPLGLSVSDSASPALITVR
ncbi:MAG: hypothetical protein MUQ56_12925 [Thermoleophilia bacterium]|nr:hypothetical protein [Thermoleophilia bacterium]